jgi:hypothetical protein
MTWSTKLVSLRGVHPIEAPDGKTLRTLDDARKYLRKLPATEATEYADGLLTKAAEEGGPYPMFARFAVYRAIYGEKPAPIGRPRRVKKADAWKEKRKAWKAARASD